MNLLFVTDTVIPADRASAVHVRYLLPALIKRFDQVHLLCQKGSDAVWSEFPEKISVRRVQRIKGLGNRGLLWTFRRALFMLKDIDIVYSRFLLFALISRKYQYILELHSDEWNKSALHRKALLKAFRSRHCQGIVVISAAIAKDLRLSFPNIDKPVQVIEDAAMPAKKDYFPSFQKKKKLLCAYIGSFYPGKGMEVIIPLAKETPQHEFHVFGGSKKEIQGFIEKGVSDNLVFHGFQSHEIIAEFMSMVDVCLLPNQEKVITGTKSDIGKYTSPLKMFEYMAYSKPIVASDLDVIKEVLDSECAKLVQPNEIQNWAKAIDELTDPNLRARLGEAARKKFIQNYTWEIRAKRIFEFVKNTLDATEK